MGGQSSVKVKVVWWAPPNSPFFFLFFFFCAIFRSSARFVGYGSGLCSGAGEVYEWRWSACCLLPMTSIVGVPVVDDDDDPSIIDLSFSQYLPRCHAQLSLENDWFVFLIFFPDLIYI